MRCKGRQYDRERLKESEIVAIQRRKLNGTDHELTDGRIEREPVDVVGHFADGLVENPQFLRRCRSIAYVELTILVVKQVPEFSKELIYTINSVGTPGFGYFKRSQEHLVHTQGVGTVLCHNIVGVDYIVLCLRHLFNFRVASEFALLVRDDRCRLQFRSPFPE